MPAILIEHPQHGRTHVYTPEALKEHEALGWREVQPPPPPKPKRRR